MPIQLNSGAAYSIVKEKLLRNGPCIVKNLDSPIYLKSICDKI